MLAQLSLLAAFFSATLAAPASPVLTVTSLTTAQLSAFAPYTQFARAAYCPSRVITGWKCGQACNALPGFVPTLVGGDGNAVQRYFVGFWPSQKTVVVAHQGTDPLKLLSVLTDANILMGKLDAKLFPGASADVRVHAGFRNEHALTAPTILAEVKRLLSTEDADSVTLIGHSLGGALAELDALYMTLNLDPGTRIKAVTYGTPRVGNTAYATFFDSAVADFQRVDNKKDVVPIVPGRLLGYTHPQGEVHLVARGVGVACSGNDNDTDPECQIKTVPSVLAGNAFDHLGPYEGIFIGTIFCT